MLRVIRSHPVTELFLHSSIETLDPPLTFRVPCTTVNHAAVGPKPCAFVDDLLNVTLTQIQRLALRRGIRELFSIVSLQEEARDVSRAPEVYAAGA